MTWTALSRLVAGGAVGLLACAASLAAQHPLRTYADAIETRTERDAPALRYTVRVDPTADSVGVAVSLDVRRAPDTLRLAFPRWAPGAYRLAEFARYVRDVGAAADGRPLAVAREDSSTWRVVAPRGAEVVHVRWRVTWPSLTAARAPNNRGFLTPTGVLLDGPATFPYLVGRTLLPSHVRYELPAGWHIATGLAPTSDARTFWAPSYDVLIDSPVLAGPVAALRTWAFHVDGVPHRVAYWARPGAPAFDTARFVAVADTIVRTTRTLVGSLPYREYTFLFVDGGGGGLEHLNSTTIGAMATELARRPAARAGTTAHELVHAWNVKRLRPAALGPFDYQREVRSTELWWSEGMTDHFGRAITRRAGLVDSARAEHDLAESIASWLNNPAATRISPQRSSWTAWDAPTVNGGYAISYYLQGALLGELLDLRLRDATGLARGTDDVLRRLYDRFAGARGFTAVDVERAASETCGCDLHPFFAAHVADARPLDFARWLALAGWRLDTTRAVAVDSVGRVKPDLRASATAFGGIGSAGGAAGNRPRLSVADPTSAWGRAGLRTGDELVAVTTRAGTTAIDAPAAFATALAAVRVDDTVRVEVRRAGAPVRVDVVAGRYLETRVRLVDLPQLGDRQRAVRRAWLHGPPRSR